MRSVRVVVSGRVQGVGYRAWAVEEAGARGLAGWVRNRRDGSVEALLSGAGEAVAAMLVACREGPRAARVDTVVIEEAEPPGDTDFRVLPTL